MKKKEILVELNWIGFIFQTSFPSRPFSTEFLLMPVFFFCLIFYSPGSTEESLIPLIFLSVSFSSIKLNFGNNLNCPHIFKSSLLVLVALLWVYSNESNPSGILCYILALQRFRCQNMHLYLESKKGHYRCKNVNGNFSIIFTW